LWAARAPGDCAGLRIYLDRFPDGVFAEEAGRRLQAAETVTEESWIAEEHRLPLSIRANLDPLASVAPARADALARAATEARTTCEGFGVGEYRLVSATAETQTWRCFPRGQGIACSFDGQAVCQVEARHLDQRQVCK